MGYIVTSSARLESSLWHTDREKTGFSNYGHRYYDPQLGRWPSRDPIGERGGLNLYGFGPNTPISGFDFIGANWFTDVLDWMLDNLDFSGGDMLGGGVPPGGVDGALDNALQKNDPERIALAACLLKCYAKYTGAVVTGGLIGTGAGAGSEVANARAKKPRNPLPRNPSGEATGFLRRIGQKVDNFLGLPRNPKLPRQRGPFQKAGRFIGRKGRLMKGGSILGIVVGAVAGFDELDCCVKKCMKEHPVKL